MQKPGNQAIRQFGALFITFRGKVVPFNGANHQVVISGARESVGALKMKMEVQAAETADVLRSDLAGNLDGGLAVHFNLVAFDHFDHSFLNVLDHERASGEMQCGLTGAYSVAAAQQGHRISSPRGLGLV